MMSGETPFEGEESSLKGYSSSSSFPPVRKKPPSGRKKSESRLIQKQGVEKVKVKGILDIPERVRVKILSYLSYEERKNAQFVCRTFRNEMRVRVGLHSRLSEASKKGLVFMRDVVVDTITIGRFVEPSLTPLQIIGRPDTVKNLIFEESITIAHLDAFLSRCRWVEKIVIGAAPLDPLSFLPCSTTGRLSSPLSIPKCTNTEPLRNWETISKEPIQLEFLRELSLILPGRKAIFYFQKLLQVVTGDNLQKLSLRIGNVNDRVDSRQIHTRVLHLLKKLKKLTHLFISTIPGPCMSKIPDSVNYLGFPRPEIREISEAVQLKGIVLTESSDIYQIWNIFLTAQKQLQIFQVLHLMPLRLLIPIISNNAYTLRKVAIRVPVWQKDNQHLPLNMQIFQDCEGLEELMIDLSGGTREGEDGLPNVVLLRDLPKSLRILALLECAFLTFDLLQMRNDHQKLQSIGLVCVKNLLSGFGVSYRTLLHLLRYPNLNELLVAEIRVNERDKYALRKVKKVLKCGFKLNRTGIYIEHKEPDKCRWIIGQNGSCLFRFASTWGISE